MKKALFALAFTMMASLAHAAPSVTYGCSVHLPQAQTYINLKQVTYMKYFPNSITFMMMNGTNIPVENMPAKDIALVTKAFQDCLNR